MYSQGHKETTHIAVLMDHSVYMYEGNKIVYIYKYAVTVQPPRLQNRKIWCDTNPGMNVSLVRGREAGQGRPEWRRREKLSCSFLSRATQATSTSHPPKYSGFDVLRKREREKAKREREKER